MKLSYKLAAFLLLGPLAAAACAKGSTSDPTATAIDDTTAVEPTEPAESVTVPPKGSSSGDSNADESSDAGPSKDAGKPGDAGSSGSTKPPPSGSCATQPPSNACGVAPQCGCAATETCDVTDTSDGSVGCIKAGSGAQAKPCTTSSQCAAGLTCAYGACRPYCPKANAACTGTGLGTCGALYDSGAAVPNAQVCTITCDLKSPSAACGANTCIWDPSLSATDCDTAGTVAAFGACSTYNDCKPGLACVDNWLYGLECEPWCRVGVAGDCASSTSCVDVYGAKAPMQGSNKLGHCQ